jgi:hypothetical protein
MGRGDASIFWYWFFDSELKFHHEFETMDLIEGEKVYREVEWNVMDRALQQSGQPWNRSRGSEQSCLSRLKRALCGFLKPNEE